MVAVWIPNPGSFLSRAIKRGSGIVGDEDAGVVVIDFEGNLYGAVNLTRYVERVAHAYGRRKMEYPTIARMTVGVDELVQVGWFDPEMPGGFWLLDGKKEMAGAMLGYWLQVPALELDDHIRWEGALPRS